MKDFLFCLFLSVISWLYFFYLRKETLKEDTDSITKFVNHGIDFRILILAIVFSFITIYFFIMLIK